MIHTIRERVRVLRATDSGATAAEYAIMAGLIAVVIAASVALFGQAVLHLFDNADLLGAL